jgi:monovalent cation:H+ antiporter-2, CPA2 family
LGIAADFVLIVLAGLCGGILARALRLPLLVGYVAAGILVGPHTAGPTVVQTHDIELLAEIGVALLLFSLGLEISLRDLLPVKRIALLGGPVQILLCGAGGAILGRQGLGMSGTESLWFGAMVSMSSTMVVLKSLAGGGVSSTLASRVMIGMLVLQDLAVIPMLILLPQLADLSSALPKLASALALAAVFLVAMVVLGRKLLPVLLRWILAWGSRELFLVAVVATGVGLGYAAHAVGLSFALGAFVAGVVLSESELSHQALSDVVPLRDVFGLLFFVSVGMLFDPMFVLQHLGAISLAVLCIFVGKAIVFGGLTRAFGYKNMAPWIVGLGLSQIGEFSFVLARAGQAAGALSPSAYNAALTCTIFTMALSPLVSSAALPLGGLWQRWRRTPLATDKVNTPELLPQGHVVVAGYGRMGRAICGFLRELSLRVVVIDADRTIVDGLRAAGNEAVWGDMSNGQTLEAAGIAHAKLLILAVSGPNASLPTLELTMQQARRQNATLQMIVRTPAACAFDGSGEFSSGGVSEVQPEFEAGMEIARQTLAHFQYDAEKASQVLRLGRQKFYASCAADSGSDSGGKGL